MSLRSYAQSIGLDVNTEPKKDPQISTISAPDRAQEIIKTYELNREIMLGAKEQIMLDIKEHQNPFTMILFCAEALDRMSGGGDKLYLDIKAAMIDEYGDTIAQRYTDNQEQN